MRAEVDSCWCEILDEVFRQGYSWVRLGKQVYGGFESGCGRRNILALRLCNKGYGKDYGIGIENEVVWRNGWVNGMVWLLWESHLLQVRPLERESLPPSYDNQV